MDEGKLDDVFGGMLVRWRHEGGQNECVCFGEGNVWGNWVAWLVYALVEVSHVKLFCRDMWWGELEFGLGDYGTKPHRLR